jgi:type IV pilus assembly protein PilE
MKKGFTLLELIVVIVIIGILATLGFAQYSRIIERSRGAEARTILGTIRTQAAAWRLENGNSITGFGNAQAGIGANADQIPSACRTTNYFSYTITSAAEPTLTVTATRCVAGGKAPDASSALTLTLTTNFTSGADTWAGTGGY